MENRSIGELIRELREERSFSQEFLAEGICDASTLSRIENGHQLPHPGKYRLLLEKLGEADAPYDPRLTRDLLLRKKLETDIFCDLSFRNESRLDEKLLQFRDRSQGDPGTSQSFEGMMLCWEDLARERAVCKDFLTAHPSPPPGIEIYDRSSWTEYFHEECLRLLRMTCPSYTDFLPSFPETSRGTLPLTLMEARLINNIGIALYRLGDHKEALRHFLLLKASLCSGSREPPTYTGRLRECGIRNNIAACILKLSSPKQAAEQLRILFQLLPYTGGILPLLVFLRSRFRLFLALSEEDRAHRDLSLILSLHSLLPPKEQLHMPLKEWMIGASVTFLY